MKNNLKIKMLLVSLLISVFCYSDISPDANLPDFMPIPDGNIIIGDADTIEIAGNKYITRYFTDGDVFTSLPTKIENGKQVPIRNEAELEAVVAIDYLRSQLVSVRLTPEYWFDKSDSTYLIAREHTPGDAMFANGMISGGKVLLEIGANMLVPGAYAGLIGAGKIALSIGTESVSYIDACSNTPDKSKELFYVLQSLNYLDSLERERLDGMLNFTTQELIADILAITDAEDKLANPDSNINLITNFHVELRKNSWGSIKLKDGKFKVILNKTVLLKQAVKLLPKAVEIVMNTGDLEELAVPAMTSYQLHWVTLAGLYKKIGLLQEAIDNSSSVNEYYIAFLEQVKLIHLVRLVYAENIRVFHSYLDAINSSGPSGNLAVNDGDLNELPGLAEGWENYAQDVEDNSENASKAVYYMLYEYGYPYNYTDFEHQLVTGMVSPSVGSTDDTFTFSVILKSNEAPKEIKLFVDGIDKAALQHGGETWETGVTYSYSCSDIAEGRHTYYFSAIVNDSTLLRFPATGTNDFNVKKSSAGWGVQIFTNGCNISSPSNPKAGSRLMINSQIKNIGLYDYASIPLKVCLVDPDGNDVDQESVIISNLSSDKIVSNTFNLDVPDNAKNGLFLVKFSVDPELDEDYTDNSFNLSFYIGEKINSSVYVVTGDYQITSDNFNEMKDFEPKNGIDYSVKGLNPPQYMTIVDNKNGMENIYNDEIDFFSNDIFIAAYDVGEFTTGTGEKFGTANFICGYETDINIPVIEETSLSCEPGQVVKFELTAAEGREFYYRDREYRVYTGSGSDYNNWIDDIENINDTYNHIYLAFRVPGGTSYGKYTLFTHVKYDDNKPSHIVKLIINVVAPVPVITTLSESSFASDDTVSVIGNNFMSSGVLNLAGQEYLNESIISWSSNKVTFIVPPEIADGLLFIKNTNGISNSVAYHITNNSGAPVITKIPDQVCNSKDTLLIGNLNNTFWDPNGDKLSFTVSVYDDSVKATNKVIYLEDSLIADVLYLVSADTLTEKFSVVVNASDMKHTVSDTFKVSVLGVNHTPKIVETYNQVSQEDSSFTLDLSMISAFDADSDSLKLIVYEGVGYTKDGNTITPEKDFNGELFITVAVTDNIDISAKKKLILSVEAVNDAPEIIGTVTQTIMEEDTLLMDLSMIRIKDPDGDTSFSFSVLNNVAEPFYTVLNKRIIPEEDYYGTLNVVVQVSDGIAVTENGIVKVIVENVPDTIITIDSAHVIDQDTTFITDTTVLVSKDTVLTTVISELLIDSLFIKSATLIDEIEFKSSVDTSVSVVVIVIDTLWDTLIYQGVELTKVEKKTNHASFLSFPNLVGQLDEDVFFSIPTFVYGDVVLTIYDYLGDVVEKKPFFTNGNYDLKWNLKNLSGLRVTSGIYIAVLEVKSIDGAVVRFKTTIRVKF